MGRPNLKLRKTYADRANPSPFISSVRLGADIFNDAFLA